jgi:hypothetical protein
MKVHQHLPLQDPQKFTQFFWFENTIWQPWLRCLKQSNIGNDMKNALSTHVLRNRYLGAEMDEAQEASSNSISFSLKKSYIG